MGRAEEAGVLAGSTLMARRKMVGPRRRERTGRRQGEEDMPSVDVWIYTDLAFGWPFLVRELSTCHHSSPSHITKPT